ARLRFLVSDAMCKPVLRRDRLDFGYDNRFQNPTICSRRLPSSTNIANDDNSVFFGKGSNADFEQIKKMILEAVAASHQPAKTSSASTEDIPAMLKKLSDLKDQGVLTEDEFLIKKADLLSRM
ncbi:SHOCT domain-containing protein, partial [Pseudomonas savastanoi]